METIKRLNLFQKAVLILMIAMSLIFAVIYARTISQVGFAYKDEILVPSQENGSTVYSGKIQGQQARFTVSADKTVAFQYGSKTYGPYTAKEDPTAVPKDEQMQGMPGVEIRQGDEILFRGVVLKNGDFSVLYYEDGTTNSVIIPHVDSDGITRDQHGRVIDPLAPSVSTILELMNDPKLTHKGTWVVWIGAVVICGINAITILFADELFYLSLRWRIRVAEYAEPSSVEITGRYVSWTTLTIIAFGLFMFGLRYIC